MDQTEEIVSVVKKVVFAWRCPCCCTPNYSEEIPTEDTCCVDCFFYPVGFKIEEE
jgi:hypothetical protein